MLAMCVDLFRAMHTDMALVYWHAYRHTNGHVHRHARRHGCRACVQGSYRGWPTLNPIRGTFCQFRRLTSGSVSTHKSSSGTHACHMFVPTTIEISVPTLPFRHRNQDSNLSFCPLSGSGRPLKTPVKPAGHGSNMP